MIVKMKFNKKFKIIQRRRVHQIIKQKKVEVKEKSEEKIRFSQF